MSRHNFQCESFSVDELAAAQDVAVRAAMSVGPMLSEHLGAQRHEKHSDGVTGSLTEWDLRAQDRIIDVLSGFDSSIGIEAEEGNVTTSRNRFWTVDPIDGTLHYSRGNGDRCHTAIGLVEDQDCVQCDVIHTVAVPVAAVIYNFTHNRLFVATSFSDAQRIDRVNTPHSFSSSLQVGADSHIYELYTDTLDESHRIENELDQQLGAITLRNVSSSQTMVDIAQGKQDGLVILDNRYTGIQDVAPGSLLVARAGGNVHSIGKSCFSCRDFEVPHQLGDKIIANTNTNIDAIFQ